MKLLIVESPTKSKTLKKFLGKDYQVASSMGHIRDLPQKELGVDIKKDFKPKYVIPTKAKKNVQELKVQAAKTENVIMATDEDREGESIAWHLAYILGLKDPDRIVFHEITKPAIEQALKAPRKIDLNLVDAQQARRVLDRLVGYKLSPFLWKKVMRGLSAGRVQSVAVRLVCEREKEIEDFKPTEYWGIEALLQKQAGPPEFTAALNKIDGEVVEKLQIKSKKEADKILKGLEGAEYKVTDVEKKETKRNPLPPFTTSTLQQTASRKLGYGAKQTMRIAQKLYENGFISYHRTDSLTLSAQSRAAAKGFIEKTYGKQYWLGRVYKTKSKQAQEAHEAIRPTYPDKTPVSLKLAGQEIKLYDLIWRRFISSQMAWAVFDSVYADVSAGQYTFHSTGQTLKFDGFLKVYPMKLEENELPQLEKNEMLELIKLNPEQHFTMPPPRYSEASLIKALEKEGIGRPSTYAPTMDTIRQRNYVEKNEQKKFIPTKVGRVVNDILVEHFPKIVDIQFTAKMETELDEIAEGKDSFVKTLRDFYAPFEENLHKKEKEVKKVDLTEKSDKTCPECGAPMVLRLGRFGKFLACSKFPNCKHTENLPKPSLGMKCPKCKEGDVVTRQTKARKVFYGCSKWPKCNFALWDKPVGGKEKGSVAKCPECGSVLVETKQKQIKCSNRECGYKQ